MLFAVGPQTSRHDGAFHKQANPNDMMPEAVDAYLHVLSSKATLVLTTDSMPNLRNSVIHLAGLTRPTRGVVYSYFFGFLLSEAKQFWPDFL